LKRIKKGDVYWQLFKADSFGTEHCDEGVCHRQKAVIWGGEIMMVWWWCIYWSSWESWEVNGSSFL